MNNKIMLVAAAMIVMAASVCVMNLEEFEADGSYSAYTLYNSSSSSYQVAVGSYTITPYDNGGGYYYEAFPSSFSITSGGSQTVEVRCEDQGMGTYDSKNITFYNTPVTTYTVTISAGSHGVVSQNQITDVPSGSSITTSSNTLTINGTTVTATPDSYYQFSSWSNASGSVTSDRTITANFSGITYTCYLNYSANGGSGAPSQQSYQQTGSASSHTFTISNTEPYRSGYTFLGWSTSSSASSPSYYGGGQITVGYNSSQTLYAVWDEDLPTYTCYLYYSANGGTGAPSTQSYSSTSTSSHTFTISLTIPTQSGYTFLGWSTSSGSTTPSYYPGGSISVGYNSSQTLYAVWHDSNYTYNSYTLWNSGDTNYLVSVGSYAITYYNDGSYYYESSPSSFSISANGSQTVTVYKQDQGMGTNQSKTVTFANVTTYTWTFLSSGNGSVSPGSVANIPTGTSITTSSNTLTVNGTTVTATPDAGYRFDGWFDDADIQISTGDTVTSNKNIYAVFSPHENVCWSNGQNNGEVSILFKLPTGTVSHTMTMDLMEPTVSGNVTTWSDSGYDLTVTLTSPSPSITATLSGNGITPVTKTTSLGSWTAFQVDMNIADGLISVTPVKIFNSFTDYTLYSNQTKNALDFSGIVENCSLDVIEHESNGSANARFSVVSTEVFLDTYGVILYNPSINLYSYFPQFPAIRANFYSFALYGDSITINGTTYVLNGSKVTVQYVTDGQHNYLPAVMPNETVRSKTMDLTNIYVTFDTSTGHVELTFVEDRKSVV